jgi:hypothetical protein
MGGFTVKLVKPHVVSLVDGMGESLSLIQVAEKLNEQAAEIEQLNKALSADHWISVDERLPSVGKEYRCIFRNLGQGTTFVENSYLENDTTFVTVFHSHIIFWQEGKQ